MKRWLGSGFAAVLLLTACVTINVHFPAVEAREAAREFVDDVIGRPAEVPADDDLLFPDGQGGMALAPVRFDPLALLGIGTAHAQSPDITVSTPAIDAIRARMRDRFRNTLRPSTAVRWVLATMVRSRCAMLVRSRCLRGWRQTRRWRNRTVMRVPCTGKSRSPTAGRSGKDRSAACLRGSGSSARGPGGGTRIQAEAGGRNDRLHASGPTATRCWVRQ